MNNRNPDEKKLNNEMKEKLFALVSIILNDTFNIFSFIENILTRINI